jgi:hypothetical protein
MIVVAKVRPWCAVAGIAATGVSSVMAAHAGWSPIAVAIAAIGTAGAVWGLGDAR